MIVLCVFTIISGAIFAVFAMGNISWYTAEVQLIAHQNARGGMDAIIRELRQTRSSAIADVPADDNYYTSITFRIPEDTDGDGDVLDNSGAIEWSDTIQYSLGGLDNKQLLRTTGGAYSVLANNVTSLQFRRQSTVPNLLEISLQTQKSTPEGRTIQMSLSSKVRLRN